MCHLFIARNELNKQMSVRNENSIIEGVKKSFVFVCLLTLDRLRKILDIYVKRKTKHI